MAKRGQPKRSRYLSVMIALVLAVQLSRFFIAVPAAIVICWDQDIQSHGRHTHEHELAAPSDAATGFSFDHCKDTYAGIDLTPAQPLGSPTVA